MKKLVLLVFALFLSASPSQAYFSLLNTGQLVKTGQYRLGLSPQFITSSDLGTGSNFTGRFDTGINEDSDFRGEAGFGRVEMHLGGSYKWVPIPDINNQPALGLLIGAFYARQNSVGTFSIRAFPMISKKFDTTAGMFDPYASLPFGLSATSNTTEMPVQFILGTEWMPPGLEKIAFWIESGFNVSKAFSYMSLMVTMDWDDQNGIEFR